MKNLIPMFLTTVLLGWSFAAQAQVYSHPIWQSPDEDFEPVLLASDGNATFVMRRDQNGHYGFEHTQDTPAKDIYYPQSWTPAGMAYSEKTGLLYATVLNGDGVSTYDPVAERWTGYSLCTNLGACGLWFTGKATIDLNGYFLLAETNAGIAVIGLANPTGGAPQLRFTGTFTRYGSATPVVFGGIPGKFVVLQLYSGKIYKAVFEYGRTATGYNYKQAQLVGNVMPSAVNASDCLGLATGGAGDLVICESRTYHNKLHVFSFREGNEEWIDQLYTGPYNVLANTGRTWKPVVYVAAGDFSSMGAIRTHRVEYENSGPFHFTQTWNNLHEIHWGTVAWDGSVYFADYWGAGWPAYWFMAIMQ